MLLPQLKSLLSRHGRWAKKGLGQHFLVDEEALERIVGAADLLSDDVVVEVGPGTGFLTERLIPRAARVVAVEYDAKMVEILKERFPGVSNLELVHQDALQFPVPRGPYKVVANIPYYITSPLLKHFLQADSRPGLMVLLVQKEVAEKVCGISGKSMITVETQVFGKPEIMGIVPAESFFPAPEVDSAILRIEAFSEPLVPEGQLKDFLRLVGFGFSQKRKKLANSLAAGLHRDVNEVRELLDTVGINTDARAENLEIGDWQRVYGHLYS
ncbi:MAG: 16S rRNA (adenine(1518)-N(6)/adenine(1519)-N(6))-dimethyltransferase RsmA [Candidatus Peregrinibacteria bacterium]